MKKFIILLSGLLLVTTLKAQVLKLNILSPIFKTANLSYEHAISKNGSIQIGFFYTGYKADVTKFNGFGITPEYRFYLSETEAPEGVYAAPFVRYQSFTVENTDTSGTGKFSAIGGGLILGKQWIFKEKIALDAFLGPAYYSGKVEADSGDESDFDVGFFDGFGLRFGVCFGVKF
ncbi:MAG: DUF3575 domain-containing protein [Cyclobacteriaceae bacterium]|nr:DUF3575 domain-containing protein [Cyclobacteriaceae bacterium]